MTATALPFLVTTTGPPSLAFRNALNWDFTSATDEIFITPPPLPQQLPDCRPSPRSPELLRDVVLGRHRRERGNGYRDQSGFPIVPRMPLVVEAACGSWSPWSVRTSIALRFSRESTDRTWYQWLGGGCSRRVHK